jgi:hypothetical protein
MAQVRATAQGFDGPALREPGDEFDMDPEEQCGSWFYYLDPSDQQRAEEAVRRRKSARIEYQVRAELDARIRQDAEERLRAQALQKVTAEMDDKSELL